MKMTQRKTRWISRLLLLAALSAQGILAAHACIVPTATAVQAVSAQAAAAAMPCHQVDKLNANACLMHCTQSDQVNLDQQHPLAVNAGELVLRVALPDVEHRVQVTPYSQLPLNTGPPLSIRYCSFLL